MFILNLEIYPVISWDNMQFAKYIYRMRLLGKQKKIVYYKKNLLIPIIVATECVNNKETDKDKLLKMKFSIVSCFIF